MTNVYIDTLSPTEARDLFNAFAEKEYISNIECNIHGYNSSSIRIECYKGRTLFNDLTEYFKDA